MSKSNGAVVVEESENGVQEAAEDTRLRMVWRGLTPLVMHNARLANPFDEFGKKYKAATGKRGKSEDDLEELARIEFEGGQYRDDELGPVIPAENIEACLVEGAKKHRKGTDIAALVSLEEPLVKVEYKGPRDVAGMWKAKMFDTRLVGGGGGRKGGGKTLRTRPMFKEWALRFTLLVDPEIDKAAVILAAQVAGKRIGLCESHFRWGRFEVEAEK